MTDKVGAGVHAETDSEADMCVCGWEADVAYAVLFPCVTLCAYVTLFVAGVHAEGTLRKTLSLVG